MQIRMAPANLRIVHNVPDEIVWNTLMHKLLIPLYLFSALPKCQGKLNYKIRKKVNIHWFDLVL